MLYFAILVCVICALLFLGCGVGRLLFACFFSFCSSGVLLVFRFPRLCAMVDRAFLACDSHQAVGFQLFENQLKEISCIKSSLVFLGHDNLPDLCIWTIRWA